MIVLFLTPKLRPWLQHNGDDDFSYSEELLYSSLSTAHRIL